MSNNKAQKSLRYSKISLIKENVPSKRDKNPALISFISADSPATYNNDNRVETVKIERHHKRAASDKSFGFGSGEYCLTPVVAEVLTGDGESVYLADLYDSCPEEHEHYEYVLAQSLNIIADSPSGRLFA